MKKNLILTLFLLIIFGCSPEPDIHIPEEIAALDNLTVFPADTEPAYELSLIPETVFGDTDDVFLSDWLLAAVDDRDRVYIADNRDVVLHLYNPDGTYHRKIGNKGEGPGEYQSIGPLLTDNQQLHLMDRNQARITRYDLDTFENVETVSVSLDQVDGPRMFPSSFFLQSDSSYIIQAGTSFSPRVDSDAERVIEGFSMNGVTGAFKNEPLYSFPDSEVLIHREGNAMMVMRVFFNRPSIVNATSGNLVHAWGDDFLFKFYDSEGNYQRAVYYPYENLPLDRNDVLDVYSDRDEEWQNIVRNADMPTSLPVLSTFTIDDEGRIWAEKMTDDPETVELVVLSNSGELLGSMLWPNRSNIQEIRNGFVYAIVPNEDTGLHEVIKYRIEFA